MKKEVLDLIDQLEIIGQRLSELANKPRVYNHPISHHLMMISNDCASNANVLNHVADRFGLEVV